MELNEDVIYTICEYLRPEDLMECCSVNKEFQKVCEELLEKYSKSFFNCIGATRSDYLYYLKESVNGAMLNEFDVKKRYLLNDDDLKYYGNDELKYHEAFQLRYHYTVTNYWIWDVFRLHFYKYGRLIRFGGVVD